MKTHEIWNLMEVKDSLPETDGKPSTAILFKGHVQNLTQHR